jgi:D-glycero-alpha-D-manno-heptose-7-phosphate kinase
MIISRTPFRVSFFGGGTDFPDYYREHGGAVLSTTIDKYCYLLTHRLSPFFKYRFRANYAKAESVKHPSEFRHPLVRECLLHLKVRDGIEIAHVADLPGRTGLGTSSSFTVGLLNALHTFLGHKVTPEDLAREAIHIERVRVGDAGGHQDQVAAAHGGLIRVDFKGNQQISVKRLCLTSQRLHELQSRLLLFYTGVEQSAGTILKEQSKRVSRNHAALKEMLQMVNEAERILLGSEDLNGFGDLLHESWLRKRSLSKGISNSLVDEAYGSARSAGARGGKLLGAGGRGFLLVCAETEKHAAIRRRLRRLQEVNFSFSNEGSQIIFRTAE